MFGTFFLVFGPIHTFLFLKLLDLTFMVQINLESIGELHVKIKIRFITFEYNFESCFY